MKTWGSLSGGTPALGCRRSLAGGYFVDALTGGPSRSTDTVLQFTPRRYRRRHTVVCQRRILAAIEHNLSNGLIESTNTKIRLITRMAFGFKSPQALTAVALLSLGGHRPTLPGRK